MRLHWLAVLVIITLILPASVLGADKPNADKSETSMDEQFEAREFEDVQGKTLLYRLLKPNGYESSKKPHPLLIFLHGSGERGSDNEAQLVHGKAFMQAAADKYGCFVLAPQCPKDERWSEVHWYADSHKISDTPAEQMRLVVELIAALEKEFRIDAKRLYMMGLSMGGFGTWDAVQRYPKMFAAAVPICGGGDESTVDRVAKLPIWIFHGDKDGAVKVCRSRDMVKAIEAAGGKPKYTEYPGVGHNSWTAAFKEPELPKWLFSRKRSD